MLITVSKLEENEDANQVIWRNKFIFFILLSCTNMSFAIVQKVEAALDFIVKCGLFSVRIIFVEV